MYEILMNFKYHIISVVRNEVSFQLVYIAI